MMPPAIKDFLLFPFVLLKGFLDKFETSLALNVVWLVLNLSLIPIWVISLIGNPASLKFWLFFLVSGAAWYHGGMVRKLNNTNKSDGDDS